MSRYMKIIGFDQWPHGNSCLKIGVYQKQNTDLNNKKCCLTWRGLGVKKEKCFRKKHGDSS